MSNDLAKVSPESKAILLNTEIIAVDQDPAGKQGVLLFEDNQGMNGLARVWGRELQDGSYAVVLQNAGKMGAGLQVKFESSMIPGWGAGASFEARDLYAHADVGKVEGELNVNVQPSSVEMFKVRLLV